jgi:glycosyltransferase involved in cell wall biosynthesis
MSKEHVMIIAHITQGGEKMMLGVEKYVLDLAGEQKAHGSSVTVITDRQGLLARACGEKGINVIVATGLEWRPRQARAPHEATVSSLVDHFKSLKPDIVNSHTVPTLTATFAAARRVKAPFVFTLHVNISEERRIPYNPSHRHAIISVAKKNIEALRRSGFPEADLYYAQSGVRISPPADAKAENQSRLPNLVCMGGYSVQKGVDLAISAMMELRRRYGADCPTLSIYGGGSKDEETSLKEMVMFLGLSEIVQFFGFQPGILERCSTSDILIMPSRGECAPLVILEAMGRGMPIVASDVGEVPEMLPDPRYGRIVPVNSAMALVEAIESLISDISNGRFDPRLLIERYRSHYTLEKMADRVHSIYETILLNQSAADPE